MNSKFLLMFFSLLLLFSFATAETCSELGGIICADGMICDTAVLTVNDTDKCCTGVCRASAVKEPMQSCSDLGGVICSQNQVCSGTLTVLDNGENCCVGQCQSSTNTQYRTTRFY